MGTLVEINGSSSYSWRCLACITAKVAQNAGGDASAVDGFASLAPAQRNDVVAAFSRTSAPKAAAAPKPQEKQAPTIAQQHKFLDKAREYDFKAVRELVSGNSAYINCQPSGRWSALHQAAEAGNAEIVQFLLERGADVTAKTNDGKTPFDVAHQDVKALLAPPGRPRKRAKILPSVEGAGERSIMYMENPMSAAALSEESGSGTSWIVGGAGDENLADAAITHQDLSSAPMAARDVAHRMSQALGGAWLPASESDTQGRVVVITGAGSSGVPAKENLLSALGLKRHVDGKDLVHEAQVTSKDFTGPNATKGFCYLDHDVDDDEDEDEDGDKAKVNATTAIMGSELSSHFELNFSEEIVAAPVLYGGRASDGNVVAVLSMRVWT